MDIKVVVALLLQSCSSPKGPMDSGSHLGARVLDCSWERWQLARRTTSRTATNREGRLLETRTKGACCGGHHRVRHQKLVLGTGLRPGRAGLSYNEGGGACCCRVHECRLRRSVLRRKSLGGSRPRMYPWSAKGTYPSRLPTGLAWS